MQIKKNLARINRKEILSLKNTFYGTRKTYQLINCVLIVISLLLDNIQKSTYEPIGIGLDELI